MGATRGLKKGSARRTPKPQLGWCEKDLYQRILKQDRRCIQWCGRRTGQVCSDGCMQAPLIQSHGTQVKRVTTPHGQVVDAVILRNAECLVTVLNPWPTGKWDESALPGTQELTARESQILALIQRGASNRAIQLELRIRPSTLKTHLNNLYRKLPSDLATRIQESRLNPTVE